MARAVASWLQDYLDAQWDRQIGQDIAADKLGEQAQARYRAGRTKPLGKVIDNPWLARKRLTLERGNPEIRSETI